MCNYCSFFAKLLRGAFCDLQVSFDKTIPLIFPKSNVSDTVSLPAVSKNFFTISTTSGCLLPNPILVICTGSTHSMYFFSAEDWTVLGTNSIGLLRLILSYSVAHGIL